MKAILSKYLKNRGVEITDLDDKEKATFDRWAKILSEGEITLEKVETLLEAKKEEAEKELGNPENAKELDMYYKALFTLSRDVLGIIQTPRSNAQALTSHIENLMSNPASPQI